MAINLRPATNMVQIDCTNLSPEKTLLGRPDHAHGYVHLAAEEIALGVADVDLEVRTVLAVAEVPQEGRQHLRGDEPARADPHGAWQAIPGGGATLDGGRLRFHRLGGRAERQRKFIRREARRGTQKEGSAQVALEARKMAAHGGLYEPEPAGGLRLPARLQNLKNGPVARPVGHMKCIGEMPYPPIAFIEDQTDLSSQVHSGSAPCPRS